MNIILYKIFVNTDDPLNKNHSSSVYSLFFDKLLKQPENLCEIDF